MWIALEAKLWEPSSLTVWPSGSHLKKKVKWSKIRLVYTPILAFQYLNIGYYLLHYFLFSLFTWLTKHNMKLIWAPDESSKVKLAFSLLPPSIKSNVITHLMIFHLIYFGKSSSPLHSFYILHGQLCLLWPKNFFKKWSEKRKKESEWDKNTEVTMKYYMKIIRIWNIYIIKSSMKYNMILIIIKTDKEKNSDRYW